MFTAIKQNLSKFFKEFSIIERVLILIVLIFIFPRVIFYGIVGYFIIKLFRKVLSLSKSKEA